MEGLTMQQVPTRNLHVKCSQLGTPTISITSDVQISVIPFGSLKISTSYMIQQPKSTRIFVSYI